MLSVHVGLEVDQSGHAQAWVKEYFGCTSHGQSQEEAIGRLPQALREFWSWLKVHGEPDVPQLDTEVLIEHVEVYKVGSQLSDGDSEGFFTFDAFPLTSVEFQRALRYISYARSDVLSFSHDLGYGLLSRMVGRSDRAVGATLNHMAFADLWYAQRSGDASSNEWQTYLLEELRNVSLKWVQRSFHESKTPMTYSVGPDAWRSDGRAEEWTLPKTLRHYIWHDLLHLRAIRRALGHSGGAD